MKKINLNFIGVENVNSFYVKLDGQDDSKKRAVIITIARLNVIFAKDGISRIYLQNFQSGNDITKKSQIYILLEAIAGGSGGSPSNDIALPVKSINGLPVEGVTIQINQINFEIIASSGNDASVGTSYVYAEGVNLLNSTNFISYEIDIPLQELLLLLTTN